MIYEVCVHWQKKCTDKDILYIEMKIFARIDIRALKNLTNLVLILGRFFKKF